MLKRPFFWDATVCHWASILRFVGSSAFLFRSQHSNRNEKLNSSVPYPSCSKGTTTFSPTSCNSANVFYHKLPTGYADPPAPAWPESRCTIPGVNGCHLLGITWTLPWRWRQHNSLKQWELLAQQHSVVSHKIFGNNSAVRSSNQILTVAAYCAHISLFPPWRWRQHDPLNCSNLCAKLSGMVSQKRETWQLTAMETWNLTNYFILILGMCLVLMSETHPNTWSWVHNNISQMSLQRRLHWIWIMHGESSAVLWISAWNRKMENISLWKIPTSQWFGCMISQTTPSSQTMKMLMMKRQVSEYDEHMHDSQWTCWHRLCGDLWLCHGS